MINYSAFLIAWRVKILSSKPSLPARHLYIIKSACFTLGF